MLFFILLAHIALSLSASAWNKNTEEEGEWSLARMESFTGDLKDTEKLECIWHFPLLAIQSFKK